MCFSKYKLKLCYTCSFTLIRQRSNLDPRVLRFFRQRLVSRQPTWPKALVLWDRDWQRSGYFLAAVYDVLWARDAFLPHHGKYSVAWTETRFLTPRNWAPPPKPCFHWKPLVIQPGSGHCYLRSSHTKGRERVAIPTNGCAGSYILHKQLLRSAYRLGDTGAGRTCYGRNRCTRNYAEQVGEPPDLLYSSRISSKTHFM